MTVPPLETCRVVGVGRPPRHTDSKGTAVKKSSQIQPVDATASPEQVTVAMSEIAESMQEGLLALAVGAGLQVMQALMEADVTALAGPKGRHDEARTAVRHGRERGSVTLGGRRVPVTRPRVRAADGSGQRSQPERQYDHGDDDKDGDVHQSSPFNSVAAVIDCK